jgi:hypothetical protein
MSLDVNLERKRWVTYDKVNFEEDNEELYSANITHNLNKMAGEAGIYEALWRPHRLRTDYDVKEGNHTAELDFEESCEIEAREIIPLLEKGLADLKARPEHFKQFDSPNGWGTYVHFVPFVEEYLNACKKYHDAIVRVSR